MMHGDTGGADVQLERLGEAAARAFGPMPDEARAAMRARLVQRASGDGTVGAARLAARRAAVALLTTSTVLASASYAAARSLPGDALYGIKRAAEEARVGALPPGAYHAAELDRLAASRIAELGRLAEEDASPARLRAASAEAEAARDRAAASHAERRGAPGEGGPGRDTGAGSGKGPARGSEQPKGGGDGKTKPEPEPPTKSQRGKGGGSASDDPSSGREGGQSGRGSGSETRPSGKGS